MSNIVLNKKSKTIKLRQDKHTVSLKHTGRIGPTGPTGGLGATGATGVIGTTGATGPLGNTGVQGATGSTGVVGITGATGVRGSKWFTQPEYADYVDVVGMKDGDIFLYGDSGDTFTYDGADWNYTGTIKGATGATGNTGVQGFTGPTGITGATGPTGVRGSTGPTGLQGATGVDGAVGATGSRGLMGGSTVIFNYSSTTTATPAAGEVRQNNATNASVTALYISETDSNSANISSFLDYVKVGDVIRIIQNSDSTRWKIFEVTSATDNGTDRTYGVTFIAASSSTISNGVSVGVSIAYRGPTGASGAVGATGVGATGVAGATGVQGATGPQGSTGVTGGTGVQGATGVQGSTGVVGATGVQGTAGNTGVQGATGPSAVSDSVFRIQDNGDATKQVAFEVSAVTTATTRTLTVQDSSDTLVGRATTDTLTNKTISGTTITDATDVVLGTTTGTKIGTTTAQKLGFLAATPVVQQAATTDLGTVLSNFGLRAAGTAYPMTTSGVVSITGTFAAGSGGARSPATTRTTNATLSGTSSVFNFVDATTGAVNITLPLANASNGQMFMVKKIDASANSVTITRAGSDTIENNTTYVLATQNKYVFIINNNSTSWYVWSNN